MARGAAHALVHLGHDGVAGGLELLLVGLVLLLGRLLVVVQPLQLLLDGLVQRLLVAGVELAGHVGVADGVLHGVGVVLQAVLGLHALAQLAVLLLVLGGVVDHAVDVGLAEAALVVGDGDLVALAGALLLRGHVEDAVRIKVEGDLDLGHAAGRGGDAGEVEGAQGVAVLGHGALALVDLDVHAGLVVRVRGEDLALLGGDGGVALDEGRHDAAGGLNAEGERGHVQQQQTLRLLALSAGQDEGLHRRAVGHGLVGVDALVQLLAAEVVGDEALHLGDAGGAADEHYVVHGALVHLGVGQHALHGLHGATEEVTAQLLEARAGDGGLEVDVVEQRVDLDGRLGGGRQRALGALAGRAQAAQGAVVVGEVLALVLALELVGEEVDEAVIEVLAAEVGITRGGFDLEDAAVDREQRHIERTAAEIEDEHVLLLVVTLVQTVGDGGRGGLVDDAEHLKTRDRAGVLGGLALGVVEVGGDGHDGLLDLLAEVGLRDLLHLEQHHGADLLGREGLVLAVELHLHDGQVALGDDLEGPVLHVALHLGVLELAADQALGVEDGVVGVQWRPVV
ncbi:NAD-specific glutamate dehydrogenase domain protein [Strigomonas culicis]|uniref:NAD-specific glutamate dehydrogenase domain protein n=1 Tax=Strigomonas culicis TaxID=28005 RepID=S9U8U4_9TRYP|nr:NAD-specific glutamate dehydrogenase domain protein [Strigomonas culicis]|eukprot:EPY27152.1 NAD-specific glutamate dehydrogenase domain protein [Strigomonas culicis]